MPTNMLRVTIHSTFRNQQAVNVLHYQTSYPTGGLSHQQLAEGFSGSAHLDALRVAYKECLSQQATYIGMKIRLLDPLNKANDVEVINTEGVGVGTADTTGILPSQLCGLISKRTANATRAGRGRFYMPFVPGGADNEPDDLLTSAYKVVLADLALEMINDFQLVIGAFTVDYVPGLMNNRVNQFFRPLPSTVVKDGFATQRRRGYFGRPNVLTL